MLLCWYACAYMSKMWWWMRITWPQNISLSYTNHFSIYLYSYRWTFSHIYDAWYHDYDNKQNCSGWLAAHAVGADAVASAFMLACRPSILLYISTSYSYYGYRCRWRRWWRDGDDGVLFCVSFHNSFSFLVVCEIPNATTQTTHIHIIHMK